MEDDLRLLLRSPALTIEPPPTLPDVVRRKARRHRLRTRAVGAGIAVVLVGCGVLLGPGLKSSIDELRTHNTDSAAPKPDPRAPHATTDVLTLRIVNNAEILTWFEGSQWCTKTTRVTSQQTCLGRVDPAHQGFSWVVPVRSPSVTVDDQYFVAGVAPPGAVRIVVHMSDGREFDTEIVSGAGFPAPVWSSVRIDLSVGRVAAYIAYDGGGKEIARKPA
ncbi:MAG: hypothetical protein QOE05_2828 [Actinomycetota bacterium]|jgi:hypothetical protein|nr:hypothetical protein [Actinomycetota bacterium]